MGMTISDIINEEKKYWPEMGKIYYYHFITKATNLRKVDRGWQKKVERKTEIVYLGRKDGFRFFQLLTTKIILTSDKAFPNKALLTKLGYVFDYLEVGVNDKGCIKRIFNFDSLKLRLQEIRNHLEKDHGGEGFVAIMNEIIELLQDEKKTVLFLQSFKMFGLYFNGLYQRFQETSPNPIIKPQVLTDFNQLEIQQEVTFIENNNDYTFTVKEKSEEEKIEKYNGIYQTEYNQLIMGSIEVVNEKKNIKYSASWVG